MKTDAAIGVVTFNRLDLLQKCLSSWVETQYPVVIWDNGSSAETVAWLQKQPIILLRCCSNIGCPAGRNRLIDFVRDHYPSTKYLLLPDSDIELLLNCIGPMIQTMIEHADTAFVSYPQANQGWNTSKSGLVEETANECQLTRMAAWTEIGRFPEALIYYSSDSWMSTIANMLGWKTRLVKYVGEGYIHHRSQGSQVNPSLFEQRQRDVTLWKEKEAKMELYWKNRLKYGKSYLDPEP